MGGIRAAVGPVGPELQANARQSEEACNVSFMKGECYTGRDSYKERKMNAS
jgi:hypothetical protein